MVRLLAFLALGASLVAAPPTFTKEGKGPAILLIHGFGGNRDVWSATAADLAKDHTVVRVDLPGNGGTPGPDLVEGAADFEAMARDMAAYVRKEKLAPCLLAGHSMGGPLAALTALQDPGAFRGVVFVDTYLGAVPAAHFEPVLGGLDADPAATLRVFFSYMAASPEQGGRMAEEALRVPVPVLKAYLRGMTRDTLKGRQAQLKLPVVCFQAGAAETDPAQREAKWALFGFKALPDARAVAFPGTRHWIMLDDPAAFLKALRAFETGLAVTRP